jgi:dTDP-4-dehydrorhamnose 3,5-epimerase
MELSAETGAQLFIPKGFAHGFCTLEPDTIVSYKVSAPFAPANDTGLRWNDPALAIDWPVREDQAVLSDKDRGLPGFGDFQTPFEYGKEG